MVWVWFMCVRHIQQSTMFLYVSAVQIYANLHVALVELSLDRRYRRYDIDQVK